MSWLLLIYYIHTIHIPKSIHKSEFAKAPSLLLIAIDSSVATIITILKTQNQKDFKLWFSENCVTTLLMQGGAPGEGALLPPPPVPRREVPLHRQLARRPFQREEGRRSLLIGQRVGNSRAHWLMHLSKQRIFVCRIEKNKCAFFDKIV